MVTFRKIFGFIPIPIFWTDRFLKDWSGGQSNGLFCIIRPKYISDEGIIEHELTHCKQYFRTAGIHSFLYLFNKNYRATVEVEAYAVQLSKYSDPLLRVDSVVESLFTKYDLGMDRTILKTKLLNELHRIGIR